MNRRPDRIGGRAVADPACTGDSVSYLAATDAIGRARLARETEQHRRWSSASIEVMHQLFAGTTEPPLDLVLRLAAHGADADVADLVLRLPGAPSTGWGVHSTIGHLTDTAVGRPVAASSAAARVIESGQPLLIDDGFGRVVAVGVHGRPETRVVGGSVACAPLFSGGRVIGALTVGRAAGRDPLTATDLGHLAAFMVDAGVALELDRARDERDTEARVQDHERIAADLHDHVIQALFATGMGLEGMLNLLPRPEHQERISAYVVAIDSAIRRIRATIFQCQDSLRPPDQVGLTEALVGVLRDETAALGFAPRIEHDGPIDTIPAGMVQDVLAVVREALSNTARHAHATNARVRVGLAGGLVSVEVSDDGDGIGAATRSSGLANLRRRAEAHNGALHLSNPVAGGGTELRWTADLRYCAQ